MRTTFLSTRSQPVFRFTLAYIQQLPFLRYPYVSLYELILSLSANGQIDALNRALLYLTNANYCHLEQAIMASLEAYQHLAGFVEYIRLLVSCSAVQNVLRLLEKLAYKRLIKTLNLATSAFIDNLSVYFAGHFEYCGYILSQVLYGRERLQTEFLTKYGRFLLNITALEHSQAVDTAFQVGAMLCGDYQFEMQLLGNSLRFIEKQARTGECTHALYLLCYVKRKQELNFGPLVGAFMQLYQRYELLALEAVCAVTRHNQTQFCLNLFVRNLIPIIESTPEHAETAAQILCNLSESNCFAYLAPLDTRILETKGRKAQAILLVALDNLYAMNCFSPDIDDIRYLAGIIGKMVYLRYCEGVTNAFNLLRSIATRDGTDLLAEFGIYHYAQTCYAIFGDGEWSEFVLVE